MWRHLTNDITITSENDNRSCSFTASQTEQNTYNCKTAHIVNILILCTVSWTCVQCVRRSVELHTTTPLTDAVVNTEFWFLMKITDSNVSESTKKLKIERKSLVKQQILMYKTAVYRLVNGGITHQNSKYLKKVILRGSRPTLTLRRCTAASSPCSDIRCFWCVVPPLTSL